MSFHRRHKYNAKPTVFRGKNYPSKAEAERAAELHAMVDAGEIQLLLEQPSFTLVRDLKDSIRYVADFLVVTAEGWWIEDVKGMKTPEFKLKMKLWRQFGPGPLRLLSRRGKSWSTEVIEPEGDDS